MNTKVDNALNRLTSILPLQARQQDCSPQIKALHRQILGSFVTQGRILTREEMADIVSDLEEAINVLKSHDLVVFSQDDTPVGAYPFTMEAREHKVKVNGHQVYAMCALDALAVSPMFGMETQVISTCRVSGVPVTIEQSGKNIENQDEAAAIHFGIIWGAANACFCCADSLCMEMMFLRDGSIAENWLAEDPDNREIFTLPEAVEFGARFFVPLMS
ncbi:MAG: alkylmercury lyase family protein [Gammaproteobacteria bacterium]|jgi:mercuric reductase